MSGGLYQRCQRVLAELDELEAEAAGARAEVSGTLRVDLPIVYGKQVVMPILADLRRRHPRLHLDVRLQDGYADLVRDGIDVAVRVGELKDSSLIARRFDRQAMVLCASPAYLAERGTPRQRLRLHQRPRDVRGHQRLARCQPADRVGRIAGRSTWPAAPRCSAAGRRAP